MQKKLLAVAVAGAFAAPAVALAQTSTVNIYGNFNLQYGIYNDEGTNRKKFDAYDNPDTNIGLRGEEKLGGGLSAWFQCESSASIKEPRNVTNPWCARNSAIGLKGAFGNIFAGTWDMPFKRTAGPNRVGADGTGYWGAAPLLYGDSTTTDGGAAGQRAAFSRRERSSMHYETPNLSGFRGMAAFTATHGVSGVDEPPAGAVAVRKARVFSIAAEYRNGPLYISGGYEQHNDFFRQSAALGSGLDDDKGWHIGANYTFAGKVKFGGQFVRNTFATNLGDVDYDAWHLGIDWNIQGPHSLRLGYTQVDDADGALGAAVTGAGNRTTTAGVAGPDTGAKLYTIKYTYALSKRTRLGFGYSRLNNDSNAFYFVEPLSENSTRGETQSAWAFSMTHSF